MLVVHGASALQYGAQFGGLVNYVLKKAPPDRRFTFTSDQTGGSNGLFNSHNRLGGKLGKFTYNGYYHHRRGAGWRENAGFDANTGFGSIEYQANKQLKIGFELTGMEYLLQMAGELTEELFKQDPRISVGPRNWFKLQWLVPASPDSIIPGAHCRSSAHSQKSRPAIWAAACAATMSNSLPNQLLVRD